MTKPSWALRMFYAMLTDPQFSFNYFNRDLHTSMKKGGKPWKIFKSQLDYQFSLLLPQTEIIIATGRGTGKSSSLSHMLFMVALSNPKKWSGVVLPNARHANTIIQSLIDYFNKDSFVREIFLGYDKKDRMFNFRNGHKIEIRIVGHDKTGERTMVSGHFDFLFVDEAQLLRRAILNELIPTMKEGAKIIVSGVPNDIRDTILYYYVSNKNAMYYRYATYEADDWDEEKERRTLDLYGGKHTPAWRNLCEGLWGDSAAAVFRPSKLVEGLIKNENFRFVSFNGNAFEELFPKLNLPILRSKYCFYIIGGDMGYTSNSPSHIVVLGAYNKADNEGKDVQHYDVVYRLEIENMASYNMAKSMNYLIEYFNCKHVAIDTQTFGHQVYDHLIDKTIFPVTFRQNKMFMYPVIFTRPVVMGHVETVDQTTGQPVKEEIRYAEKVAGTAKMVELVEDERFHISHADSGVEDFDDLVTIMMAETQIPSMNRLFPFTYTNSVNDHCFVAGTLITTIDGDKPIETLTTDDYALTRYGYQPVLRAWLTRRNAEVNTFTINGIKLTCTPEHKVLINGEFAAINTLKIGDVIETINTKGDHVWQTIKQLSLMGISIYEILTKTTIVNILQMLENQKQDYIEKYGSTTMEKLPKDTSFIILILIQRIMMYQIYKWYLNQNMLSFTKQETAQIQNLLKPEQNYLTELDHLLKNGTLVKKVDNGIQPMQPEYQKLYLQLQKLVNTVENNTKQNQTVELVQNIVQQLAKTLLEEKVRLTMKQDSALYAGKNITQTNIPRHGHAQCHVVESLVQETVMNQDVYNLTIKNHHEYFANGMSVLNCTDALRCCALVILQVIEKGLSRTGFSQGLAKPVRLSKGFFKPTQRRPSRRRHH